MTKMKMTLSTYDTAEALRRDENAGWSYNGAKALAEYLEQYEQDSGTEMELDVVAIRCDFSEHISLLDWANDYFGGDGKTAEKFGIDYTDSQGDEHTQSIRDEDGNIHDEVLDAIKEYICDNGQLIEFDGGIIVSSF